MKRFAGERATVAGARSPSAAASAGASGAAALLLVALLFATACAEADDEFAEQDLPLEPLPQYLDTLSRGSLAGVVVDRDGASLEGAEVGVYIDSLLVASASSDPEGRWSVDDIPARDASVLLRIERDGYHRLEAWVPFAEFVTHYSLFGLHEVRREFELERGGSVEVAIDGVVVDIHSGEWLLDGVPYEGRVFLDVAVQRGRAPHMPTYPPSLNTSWSGYGNEFLHPRRRIFVGAVTETGEALVGGDQTFSQVSATDHFDHSSLRYRLDGDRWVRVSDWRHHHVGRFATGHFATGSTVSGLVVTARILDVGGSPRSGFEVSLFPDQLGVSVENHTYVRGLTSSDGTFRAEVASGLYLLSYALGDCRRYTYPLDRDVALGDLYGDDRPRSYRRTGRVTYCNEFAPLGGQAGRQIVYLWAEGFRSSALVGPNGFTFDSTYCASWPLYLKAYDVATGRSSDRISLRRPSRIEELEDLEICNDNRDLQFAIALEPNRLGIDTVRTAYAHLVTDGFRLEHIDAIGVEPDGSETHIEATFERADIIDTLDVTARYRDYEIEIDRIAVGRSFGNYTTTFTAYNGTAVVRDAATGQQLAETGCSVFVTAEFY